MIQLSAKGYATYNPHKVQAFLKSKQVQQVEREGELDPKMESATKRVFGEQKIEQDIGEVRQNIWEKEKGKKRYTFGIKNQPEKGAPTKSVKQLKKERAAMVKKIKMKKPGISDKDLAKALKEQQ